MPDEIRLVLNDEDAARVMAVLCPGRPDAATAPGPERAPAGAPADAAPPRGWLARMLDGAAGVLARFR